MFKHFIATTNKKVPNPTRSNLRCKNYIFIHNNTVAHKTLCFVFSYLHHIAKTLQQRNSTLLKSSRVDEKGFYFLKIQKTGVQMIKYLFALIIILHFPKK